MGTGEAALGQRKEEREKSGLVNEPFQNVLDVTKLEHLEKESTGTHVKDYSRSSKPYLGRRQESFRLP